MDSMIFGVPALVTVGLSWTLTGVVMSEAPRKNTDPAVVMLLSGITSMLISVVILIVSGMGAVSLRVWALAGGCYFLSSAINFLMLQIMSHAMQRGPNGVIWAIIQSALVFPFIVGVLFYGSEMTVFRGIGLGLVLAALSLFAVGKENRIKGGKWLFSTVAAFLMTGVILSLNTIPSYYEELRSLSSIGRAICSGAGALLAGGLWNISKYRSYSWRDWYAVISRPLVWKYILMLKCFGLICSYLLLYPGLDAMAKANAGAISYPLIVGSCIAGFTVYSAVKLKEKSSIWQWAGIVLCIAGLAFLV